MGNLIKHLQLGLKKSSIGNIIDTISGNRILFYAMISVFMLPLFLLRDFTINNELRYVSIVREAVNNGNLMTFYNQGNCQAR